MGFLAYWWMQTPPAAQKQRAASTQGMELRPNEADTVYGPGSNVWIKKYNEETTNLASRFKADSYKPRNDGWVVVKNPRAQFFMNDGRAIFIEGDTGEIIMDDNKTGMKALSGSRDTPSRGRLYNVKIRLFHDITEPERQLDEEYLNSNDEKRPKPAMTITLNNASFDNQTFKIYSEAYGKGKGHVAADMVPVTLRGDDYDFDGKGLVIRWNERDRRLQLLEVAHGEKLTIKHPNQFMKKEQPTVAMDGPFDAVLPGPLPAKLVAKNRDAAAGALPKPAPAPAPAASPSARRVRPNLPKPKITPSTDPPLYRAIFHDNVKIVQGDEMSALANKMSIDFLMQDQEKAEKSEPAPKPAEHHAGKSASTQPTTAAVASTQTAQKTAAPAATQMAQKLPATRPSGKNGKMIPEKPKPPVDPNEKPVVITWTGKLVVEPLSVGTENPIKNGDAVIRLDGTPVVATQQGSTIRSGTLTYRTEDQAMLLTPMSAVQPVTMTDTKGAIVETTRLDFFQPKHQAILYGASNATFPQEDDAGKPTSPLLAKWTKTCTLYFAPGDNAASGSMNIERAELEGNVDVTHPQIKIKSDALELSFDTNKAPTTRPTTRATTLPVNGATTEPSPADARLLVLQKSLADLDARIAQTSAPFGAANPDAMVQAKSKELETIENNLAQLNKTIRDRTDTGQSTPQTILDQADAARKQFATAKVDFDLLQRAAMRVQDLRGERGRIVKETALLQKQVAAAKPAPQRSNAATTQATTQATTRPAVRTDLRQLVATGTVHCEMTDSAKKTQTIDCNHLTLQTAATADGKIYPKTVNADGEVHVIDPEQDLRAGHLAVVLRPSTQPSKTAASGDTASAELQSLIAHESVKVVSKDGTITTSDELLVENKDGKNNVKLLGEPYARIIDKQNILSGPIIEIFPDAQQLRVDGAGNMKGTQQEKPGDPQRPINVTWVRSMNFDGKTNVVDVTGQVVAVTQDADGATNTARGDRVKMLLADVAPTTRPSSTQPVTQPVSRDPQGSAPTTQLANTTTQPTTQFALATTNPTTRATTKPSRSDYGMASKTVRHITFDDNATIESVTLADDGSLLRRTHLEAATVNYDLLLKQLLIPVEGRMIVEDHRPTTQPTANGQGDARPAGAKVDNNAENNRGTTAFHWPIRFTYDDSTHQAVMVGEPHNQVVVVHRDDSPKAQSYRLTSDTVTADLEEVATTQPTTKPATQANAAASQPATKPADRLSKTQLKRVTATGNLLFTGPGAEIHALYMEYDPKTHWLTARGNEQQLVEFSIANQPIGDRRAEELHYNLESGEVQASKMTVRMGR